MSTQEKIDLFVTICSTPMIATGLAALFAGLVVCAILENKSKKGSK